MKHMDSSVKTFCFSVRLLLTLFLTAALFACAEGGDPDEEGGIIGTGFILQGTISDSREFASNTIELKSSDGVRFSRPFNESGKYNIENSVGLPPYLIRADLGNNEYRYGITFGDQIANVHSYSDVVLRNWFSSNGLDIDTSFSTDGPSITVPTEAEFNAVSTAVYALFESVLDSYQLSAQLIQSTAFDANNLGIDKYLDDNPLFIKDGFIQAVITDPETKTQSTTRSNFSVFTLATQADNEVPSAPTEVRALPSALDEIVLVWEPATDDMGVVAYRIYRENVFVATTPFPVYTDSALLANTTYTYEVTAIDSVGNESLVSLAAQAQTLAELDTTAPPVPVQLNVTPDIGRMNLIWGQNDIADVVAFNVYRSAGDGAPILQTKVTSTVLTDTKVSSGTTYCYQVAAIDASGNASELSEADCADTPGAMVRTEANNNIVTAEPLAGLNIPDLDALECTETWELSSIVEPMTVDGGCYRVTVNIKIENGGNLTLKPNAVLLFEAGLGIEVRTGGSLSLLGEKTAPAVLSAVDRVPGYWDGVEFNKSSSSKNIIQHSVIEYAGGGSSKAALNYESTSNGPTSTSLMGSLIRWTAGVGLSAEQAATTFREMSGNVITQNAFPVVVNFDVLQDFGSGNYFSQNLEDVIELGSVSVNTDSELRDYGVAYLVDGFKVKSANLTIFSGVEVRFSEGAAFDILGSVRAIGDVKEIVFTGSNKQPGHWIGVLVTGSVYLSNVRIEYGGKYSFYDTYQSNLQLNSGGVASLKNVTIQHSLEYGLGINQGDVINASNVDVSLNGIAGKIRINKLDEINEGFWFSENINNVIELDTSAQVRENLTINDVGASYKVDNKVYVDYGGIIVNPGVSFIMSQGAEIEVYRDGYFRAIGTFNDPISFMSAKSGFPWNGIVIDQSSELNELSNVVIENAGAGEGAAAIYMNCTSGWNGYLRLSDIRVSNSRGWGVSVGPDNCVLDLAGEVTYSGNDLGNVLMREQ